MQIQQDQQRLDSSDIAFLDRELRHVDPGRFMTMFAGNMARRYIPLIEGVSPLVNEYSYKMCTIVGDADVGAPGSNTERVVSVKYQNFVSGIEQVPVSMKWTTREIKQSAAFQGGRLQDDTIRAAMNVVARKRDRMIAFGLAGSNIKGALNNSAVNATTPSTKTGTGGGTAWIRAVPVNPDEILADIAKIVSDTRNALLQASLMVGGDEMPAFDRFLLLLPSDSYAYIAQTPRSTTSDKTILRWALDQNPWLESIEEWNLCNTAGASNARRAFLMPAREPMAIGCIVPEEWSQEQWQYAGHNVIVPASGSCGGTVIKYPVACRYMDGI